MDKRGKSIGRPAPEAPGAIVDPAVLNRIAEETSKMDRSDKIHHWDRRQTGPDAILCGNDKTHGPLQMMGNGGTLLCPAVKNGAPCTYNLPVSA